MNYNGVTINTENINHTFLDGVINGEYPDVYFHFGVSSEDAVLKYFKDVKAVIVCGSGNRANKFANSWSQMNNNAEIIALPKEDRFVTSYCNGVLFASHGMGMPSASICIQELMRMVYFLKDGNTEELDKVFWARVGTSGGIGVDPGTVIVSTKALMADLKPYRLLNGGSGEYWFDGDFPSDTIKQIVNANEHADINIETGVTISANEFFVEQFRLDGAICMETPENKTNWLNWIHDRGVRNFEMEGAMFAGYLNHWGFSQFAMICTTLVNRFDGDQISSSNEEMSKFNKNSSTVMFNYLKNIV